MSYKLKMVNGNPLVSIEEGLFLLDTGLTISVSFDGDYSLIVNDKNFNLKNGKYIANPNTKDKMMKEAFNQEISGVIGLDIISSFDKVEVDLENLNVTFGTSNKPMLNQVPINNYMQMLYINGNKTNAFLDTGAHMPLVLDKSLLKDASFLGFAVEPHWTNMLKAEVYKAKLEFNNNIIESKVLYVSKEQLPPLPFKAFFSLNGFAKKYYVFDNINNLLYFE